MGIGHIGLKFPVGGRGKGPKVQKGDSFEGSLCLPALDICWGGGGRSSHCGAVLLVWPRRIQD